MSLEKQEPCHSELALQCHMPKWRQEFLDLSKGSALGGLTFMVFVIIASSLSLLDIQDLKVLSQSGVGLCLISLLCACVHTTPVQIYQNFKKSRVRKSQEEKAFLQCKIKAILKESQVNSRKSLARKKPFDE